MKNNSMSWGRTLRNLFSNNSTSSQGLQTSDKVSEEQRHLSDGPLDGLSGDEERHQVSGRHIADGHQVAAVVERAQDNPIREEIGPP